MLKVKSLVNPCKVCEHTRPQKVIAFDAVSRGTMIYIQCPRCLTRCESCTAIVFARDEWNKKNPYIRY